ncbi:hypothetical protein ACJMK2_014905 [Sinanodonta woodiana]|uniref:Uncharacterized protein n=1 Tax=Sinanodonta woodiana TaxID=1069815 RepID=A0ABD3V571_SINWO
MATGGEQKVGYNCLVKDRTITLEEANKTPAYRSIVICQDKIIVADKNDNKIKIHRLRDGKLLDMLDSESKPRAICLTDATTICVLHLDGLIEIVSIKSEDMSPVFTREKSFRLDVEFDECHWVVRVNDHIVVTGVKHYTIYWCIVSLDDGHVDTVHRICKTKSGCNYVAAKDNIIHIWCDTCVYRFDIINLRQCKYESGPFSLNAIAINDDGNIFVCDKYSEIHELTASYQLVNISSPECLRPIYAMFWDNGQLYVTCLYSREITVLRHVYQEGSHTYSEFISLHKKIPFIIFETSTEIEQGNVDKGQSSEEVGTNPSIQIPNKGGDNKQERSHEYSEFPTSHGKKPNIIVKTSKEIEHRSVDKGQSDVKTTMILSGERPKDSENAKQDQNSEEYINFIEFIKENNFRQIGLLLKNRTIPSKRSILHAIKEHGHNKGIQCLLRGMANILRKQIPGAMRVWCGYRAEDLYTPIFVVMFSKKTVIPEKMTLVEPYDEYEIVFRNEHTPNDEEEQISQQSKVNASTIKKEDIARVQDCIAKNTERLMNEHSNLSIIAASTVKAMGFNGCLSECKLIQSMCIVLYVPIKGIIPVGEKEFLKDIDGLSTDVREGEFVFHGRNKAEKWHPNLRMGCLISTKHQQSGTLGGFIDLPGGKTGCITAAHVVLNDQQIKYYIKSKKTKKARYNASLAKGQDIIEIYQPTLESAAFGKVSQIAFEEGNKSTPSVDAAIIEITDHGRTPTTGLFPSSRCRAIGFTKENPMMYNSGKTRHQSNIPIGSRVVKYGCSTNITHGELVWDGLSVKTEQIRGKSWNRVKADNISYPKFFNQMLVKSSGKIDFSMPGDSGALVFIHGTRSSDLETIGLLIGGSTHRLSGRMSIVTPIRPVFQHLGLEHVMFKRFPAIHQGDQSHVMNEIIDPRQRPQINYEISDIRLNELKEGITEALKQDIREAVKEEVNKVLNEKMKTLKEGIKEELKEEITKQQN